MQKLLKKDLQAMPEVELAAYGNEHFGLDLNADEMHKTDVLEAVWKEQKIYNEQSEGDDTPPTPATTEQAETEADKLAKRKVKVVIGQEKGESPNAVVGVNGTMYQIKRGVAVEVPYPVYEVLKNAKEELFEKDEDGSMRKISRNRFNVSVEV